MSRQQQLDFSLGRTGSWRMQNKREFGGCNTTRKRAQSCVSFQDTQNG